jgi:hypothetical protein
VRSYVVLDGKNGGKPVEVGVAMSEEAMNGLPAPMAMSAGAMPKGGHAYANMNVYLLDLPTQKAASFPAAEYRAPFYIDAATPAGAPPAAVTVPQMGLHWLDVRSPELQGMADPPENFKPFTKTFIYGSWDGPFIFDEPMITRADIVAKKAATDAKVRDEVIPVSTAQRYAPGGYYPSAYRIMYDAQAKEYRVALMQLSWRD